jgi:hypothetical protein
MLTIYMERAESQIYYIYIEQLKLKKFQAHGTGIRN